MKIMICAALTLASCRPSPSSADAGQAPAVEAPAGVQDAGVELDVDPCGPDGWAPLVACLPVAG